MLAKVLNYGLFFCITPEALFGICRLFVELDIKEPTQGFCLNVCQLVPII
jgi:hypothetical protein